MASNATTKMSSKGQIVIPEEVRNKLGLKTGDKFYVMGENDVVVLKTMSSPSLDQFSSLIKLARQQARSVGIKQSDINHAVTNVRKHK
jgi:AbrB family looped-hinge helix DNA binding protein